MSGYSNADLHALRPQVQAFLAKPFTIARLTEVMRELPT